MSQGGRDAPSETLLSELRELAGRLGIDVRTEPFDLRITAGKGGLCRIGTRYVIFVDTKLSTLEQVGVVGLALGDVMPDGVEVPPHLRPYLQTGHGAVRELLRPRPLARAR